MMNKTPCNFCYNFHILNVKCLLSSTVINLHNRLAHTQTNTSIALKTNNTVCLCEFLSFTHAFYFNTRWLIVILLFLFLIGLGQTANKPIVHARATTIAFTAHSLRTVAHSGAS